jgi:hypothetical protein
MKRFRDEKQDEIHRVEQAVGRDRGEQVPGGFIKPR